jgi:hypothetical protein
LNAATEASRPPAATAARATVDDDPQQTQPLTSSTPEQDAPSPWSLNGSSSSWSPDSTETAYAPPIDATSVSAPVAAAPTRFEPAAAPATDAASFPQTGSTPNVWAADYDGTSPTIVTDQGEYAVEEESLRGFFFGVVAVILILVVAAIYGWTITPDGSLRDTIQGWINDIS